MMNDMMVEMGEIKIDEIFILYSDKTVRAMNDN